MLDKLNYLIDNYDELFGSLSDEEFFRPFKELGIELVDIPILETRSIALSDNMPYYEEISIVSEFELLCA